MYNITIVATHHSEFGKCNSDELSKIIQSIKPDVIFEELPPDLFNRIYKENLFDRIKENPLFEEPPEIRAINEHLQNHNIEHIPVDIDLNQNLSSKDINYMLDTFSKFDVVKKIESEQRKLIERDGFAFLNSKKCVSLFEKKKITEKKLIEFMINKDRLYSIYEQFYEEIDNREYRI